MHAQSKKKNNIGPYAIIIFIDIHWFTSLKKQILDISIMTLISPYSWETILSMKVKVTQLCLTLCDCIVHGILQVRTLEWAAFLFSRGSSQPRDQTQVSHIANGFFPSWATSWTIKKVEHWRTDAFENRCWRRLLRVPWMARRSNQSIWKEISREYSLEGLMLKLNSNTLATWCEELTHWERPWCWERLKEGGEEDDRGWDGWMASLTQWT